MLGYVGKDSHDIWKRMEAAPLPKVCGFIQYASVVDKHTEDREGKCFWSDKIRAKSYDGNYPVETKRVNLNIAGAAERERNGDSSAIYSQAKTVVKELQGLGVEAYLTVGKYLIEDELSEQFYIELPRIKLEGDPVNPREIPDFEVDPGIRPEWLAIKLWRGGV